MEGETQILAILATDPSLTDRVVIVTGGSRGLGREMAMALVEAGARVVVVGLNDSPQLAQTVKDAEAVAGQGRLIPMVADVRRDADCQRVAAETLKAFGAIDVLFNNAGLGLQAIENLTKKPRTMFWETHLDAWYAIVDTNVHGVFLMARAVAPTMLAQKFGKIINVSTNRHTMLRLGGSSYGGAKAFVETASRVWANELEGTGVTVNVLLPGGPIDTGIRSGPLRDDKFWPISIMRAPTLWLTSDLSNGHTAQRFLARLWDETLPLPERIKAAREDGIDKPMLM
jgi:NAD(P)-dependent dehydrogenase (short-subunit alcohol dehydrogenase family)